jgi:polyisoprenoid-binding protein YceI
MTSTSEATGTTQISAGTWAIDPVHSSIGFSVRHLMVSKVRGNFESFSGTIVVADDGTPSVAAEIAVDSIHTNNEQRDAHIKSADFFEVEKYPTATFRSTGVRRNGENYVLDGEFTLKGVTKPVSLALEFYGVNPGVGHGEVAGFEASVVLNRKDFGIDIDMPLETGGTVVGDKVTITLEIEALKQACHREREATAENQAQFRSGFTLGAGRHRPPPHTECAPVSPIRTTPTIDETLTATATIATTTVATVRRLSDRLSSQCITASATATTSRPIEK